MSTWISDMLRRGGLRPVLVICASVVVSGCLDGSGAAGVPVARRAALAGGAVVVVPPAGYCLDRSSIADRPGGSFALIASCESLTGRPGGGAEPAVITVSISPPQEGREQPEAAALAGALGRGAALSEVNGDGLIVVQVKGAGALPRQRGDTRHWRGAMVVNNRLVGLALYGAPGSDLSGDNGERLLVALAEAIRENSPFRQPALPQVQETTPATRAATAPQTGLGGIFGRLFP